MDKNKKISYAMLVYILLGSVSVILFLLGVFVFKGLLSSVLIDLSTEFLGAVIIFIFINRLLLAREYDASFLLEQAIKRLDKATHFLKSPEQNPPFDELISNARKIYLLGNSFVRLLRTYEANLIKRIDAGAEVRIIFLDPRGEACKLLAASSGRDVRQAIMGSINIAFDLRQHSLDSKRGKVEIRLIDWTPSCGMYLIDPDAANGYIRVTVYPPDVRSPLSNRVHFILSRDADKRWYEQYYSQYRSLWDQATPIHSREEL